MSAAVTNATRTAPQWTHANGVVIVRGEHNTFGVMVRGQVASRVLKVQIDHLGRRYLENHFDAAQPYRDALVGVNLDDCMIRVLEGETVLAELGAQPQGHLYQPWMVRQGEQVHETENYVSVPPALHVTDEVGARWTLGFETAPKDQSPGGEFAFNVLRDGVDAGETASRIECRNGKVRVFTRRGWKRWLGREWS